MHKPRLLIADDSQLIRKEMCEILADEYDVVEAENGEQAWTLISSDKEIKMIFTDLTMPSLDGLKLLKRIRSTDDESLRSLPVVMMTEAADDLANVKESLASGVNDLVRKPFIPELLRARASANIKPRAEKKPHTETATVDPLTQLANEPYFMLRGANNLSYAIRHDEGFGVLLVDIDRFKLLCEEHESYVIESLQVKIGSYITSVVRAEDIVARLDEGTFGVLLLGVDPKGVLETASRIHQKIKKKIIRYNEKRFGVTVSIGAASPQLKRYSSFELILRQAWSELKKAMDMGGNQIEAENIYQRLAGEHESSHYVPSVDEALEMLRNNQGKLIDHCVKELLVKLLPLLAYCDEKMKLDVIEQINEKLQSNASDTVL